MLRGEERRGEERRGEERRGEERRGEERRGEGRRGEERRGEERRGEERRGEERRGEGRRGEGRRGEERRGEERRGEERRGEERRGEERRGEERRGEERRGGSRGAALSCAQPQDAVVPARDRGPGGQLRPKQQLRVRGFASWLDRGGRCVPGEEWAQRYPSDTQGPDEFLAQRSGVFNTGIKPFQERHQENRR
ncbi:hypothetical protein GRJ2_001588500 [Grus japonensis]|uniref:Uncharacterized protein n=1 Tax=Grus japonensis TaxID=30415 RepID=A0ABC9X3A0_GRUJA